MKRKTLYAFGLSAVLGFSTLSGCGCGAVQTSEPTQQEISTVEEESTSSTETISQEETNSVTETETVETESETTSDVTVTEETAFPEEIGIIEMDAIMYATTSVNERKEPSADSEKIGSLSTGEEVHVTGQTKDEQWYRIEISGIDEGFVASQYLSNDKPIIEQSESQAPAETVPTPAPQETVPVDSLTEAQQKVVDQINQGQQQTGGTPVDNGGSAEADALLGGAPTGATDLPPVSGDLDISGSQGAGGILHAE